MTDRYPLVRQPLQIASCTVPNRIVRTSHRTIHPSHGEVTERLIRYHEARAAGGVGLSVIEATNVHRLIPYEHALALFDDSFVPSLARLVERIRPFGMKLFQQLYHTGANSRTVDGSPRWSSSDTPDPVSGSVPVAMTRAMIDEVVESFATAARRCEAAGIEGIEVHGAHGYLCHQFLTPIYNRREDEYGGSLENRMRFICEVLAACREAVSDGFPVGVRLSNDDCAPNGLGPSDQAEIARRLEAAGLVDFVSVSRSTYHDFGAIIGPMYERPGYQLDASRIVTTAVSVPTMVAGRILNLDQAEAVLADGTADMVSMVRATIADPDLVRKTLAGEGDRVRPCIGCNQQCVGLLMVDEPIGCAVNTRAGREGEVPQLTPSEHPQQYVIVGGGVGGMEAARAAALRGHRVTLFEADDELGGRLAIAGRASARGDLLRITEWLADELRRSEVEVRTGVRAGVEEILALDPDVVVIATGAVRAPDGIQRCAPGAEVEVHELGHVVSSLDVLAGGVAPASHALVFDDRWDTEAVSVAETLLDRGTSVTFATSASDLAPVLDLTYQRGHYLTRLGADERFELKTRQAVERIDAEMVVLRALDGGRTDEVLADLVVWVGRVTPREELADELRSRGVETEVIGDALEGTTLVHAIHGGYLAVAGR